jgi:AMMECR1 domain-containing protein
MLFYKKLQIYKICLYAAVFCLLNSGLFSNILDPYKKIKGTKIEKELLNLAHKSIKFYLSEKRIIKLEKKDNNLWPGLPVGVFITLVKENKVRSCVGHFYPRSNNFKNTIINTSIEATYMDSRFMPLTSDDLNDVKIIITIVGEKWIVKDPFLVDLMRYGLLIKKNNKTATILPGEARTVSWGIKEILKKGKIESLENAEYIVFETVTFDERYLK